jgi:hypothetical protein
MSPARRKPSARPKARRPGNEGDFWGTAHGDPDDGDRIRPADDPATMIASLGPAPLPGRETIAEHYFVAIYERAAAIAGALAASSDLLHVDDPDDVDT